MKRLEADAVARFRRGLERSQVLDVEIDEKQFSTLSDSYALTFSLLWGRRATGPSRHALVLLRSDHVASFYDRG